MTLRDIELAGDPAYQRVADMLPATAQDVSARGGVPEAEGRLRALAEAGFVRRHRDGRWHAVRHYLREPRPEDFDEPHRTRVAEFLDEEYARELRLLAWSAEHRDEFGAWGKAHRATARLAEADLREWEAEHLELLIRCCRRPQGSGAREVTVRFYAFPSPAWCPPPARGSAIEPLVAKASLATPATVTGGPRR